VEAGAGGKKPTARRTTRKSAPTADAPAEPVAAPAPARRTRKAAAVATATGEDGQ
jgi:hypothetical protein